MKSASLLLALSITVFLPSYLGCVSPSRNHIVTSTLNPPPGLNNQEKAQWWEEHLDEAKAAGQELDARQELGELYLKTGRYELARGNLRRVLYQSQDSQVRTVTQTQIGESYLREGDAINAETELRKAVSEAYRGTEREKALLLLSLSLEAQGKNKEASNIRSQAGPSALIRLASLEKEIRDRLSAPMTTATPNETTAPSSLRIFPRSAWSPEPIRKNYDPMLKVSRITVHHTGDVFTPTDLESTKAEIRKIQRVHQKSPDHMWADIGYHYILDRSGNIWEARPIWMQGAHAGNPKANENNLGICVLGNYDQQSITYEQEKSLRTFLEYLSGKYSIGPSQVYTHQEVKKVYSLAQTECPGTNLQNLMERIRREKYQNVRPVLLQTSFSRSKR